MFLLSNIYSTGQFPDYLIVDNDTVPIFNNPLEQYFQHVGNRQLIEFENSCFSTACWRGYIGYWKLEHDSLFLVRISPCTFGCSEANDVNLKEIFGSEVVFANWYSGTLNVPRGNLFSGSDMGYNAIYEYEEKIEICEGVFRTCSQVSNLEYIETIKNDRRLYHQVLGLKDTILFLLNRDINWEKLENSNLDCSDAYFLFYGKDGILKDLKMEPFVSDSISIWEKILDWRNETVCSRKIKKALKGLSLDYFKPHKNFIVRIEFFYIESKLRIWHCEIYYWSRQNNEIEEWVKKQMNITD